MKIRCIYDTNAYADDCGGGPGIGHKNDLFFLSKEDWLEIKVSSPQDCKRDNVVCWQRGFFSFEQLQRLNTDECYVCLGPNSIFGGNDRDYKDRDSKYIENFYVNSILVLTDEHKKLANQLCDNKYCVKKIKRVRHFLRPHIYKEPFYAGEQEWDVLFLVKGNINQDIKYILNKNHIKWTSLVNPWWQPEELEYKAKKSKVCIVGSQWDTWGLAAHEINAFGCPLIAAEHGMMAGNMSDGMGIFLDKEKNKQVIGADLDEVFSALEKVKQWSRKDVRLASLDFHDPIKLIQMYKDALLV